SERCSGRGRHGSPFEQNQPAQAMVPRVRPPLQSLALSSRPFPHPLLLLLLLPTACATGTSAGSMGAVFARDNETRALYVREVPEGLAAAAAGLEPGDQVVMIDGLYVGDLSGKEVRARLRGDVGTTVSLTVLRGNDVHHVRFTRGKLAEHVQKPP